MFEATLSLAEPLTVLSLFGARDQHLRTIRENLGVSITHRDGEIRVAGEEQAVNRATQVLEELRHLVEKHGAVEPEQVHRIVSRVSGNGHATTAVGIETMSTGRRVQSRTAGQKKYIQAVRKNDIVFAIGPAGTGKTYLAVALAVEALKQGVVRKIVLVRPAVEAGESLGFLPGDMQAKINPYLRPLLDALREMIDYDQVRQLMEQDVIEVIPLGYMRGRTLNEAFVILDEAQNTTVSQMKMFLTRMGEGSHMVVSGDITQVDLPLDVRSGLTDALTRLQGVRGVGSVRLNESDIVRHRLVQDIVRRYEGDTPHASKRRGRR